MEHASRPRFVVGSQFAQFLDFFDAETLERVGRIDDVLAQPHEIVLDPARRLAYLTHTYRAGAYGEGKPKGHELSVIDVDAQEIVDVIDIDPFIAPHDIDFDPARDLIYTGVEEKDGRNGIVVVDAATRKVVDSIPVEAPDAHWFGITPDGTKAYLTHKPQPVISIVDLVGRKQLGTVPSPGGAEEIDCSPDGRHVFAATPMMSLEINVAQGQLNKVKPAPGIPAPRLLRIDVESGEITGQLDFDEYLSAVRVAPDGRVVVTEMRFPEPGEAPEGPVPGRVNVVDPDSMELLASVPGDELPFTTRFTGDSSHAWVANLKTGSVTIVDLAAYEVTATLDNNIGPGFGGTHGMCFIPPLAAGAP